MAAPEKITVLFLTADPDGSDPLHIDREIREIQERCRITSTSVVDYNLKALEEKGYLRRNKKISRGLELTGLGNQEAAPISFISLPLAGYIAAGEPIAAPEDVKRLTKTSLPMPAYPGIWLLCQAMTKSPSASMPID